jgi:hypothetical protein
VAGGLPLLLLQFSVEGCGVKDFINAFVREPDGSWKCIEPATFNGPPRVQVVPGMQFRMGKTFMGVDLATLLEQHYLEHRLD